jgi:hypothetical protein
MSVTGTGDPRLELDAAQPERAACPTSPTFRAATRTLAVSGRAVA